jgi:cytochrome c5
VSEALEQRMETYMKSASLWLAAVVFLLPTGLACAQDGAAIYRASCAACHNGMNNAAYKGRNVNALTSTIIAGKGAMKPRAGNASLKDEEIRAAVVYMLSRL